MKNLTLNQVHLGPYSMHPFNYIIIIFEMLFLHLQSPACINFLCYSANVRWRLGGWVGAVGNGSSRREPPNAQSAHDHDR